MSVTRITQFQAKETAVDSLLAFLKQVVPGIASSSGCLSCKLLQSQDSPTRFVVLEVWDNIDSHKAAVRNIPPEAFAKVLELLAAKPVGEYFNE